MTSSEGWYSTIYTAGGHEQPDVTGRYAGHYGGHIWARSWRHARAVARRRGIYEVVDGYIGTKRPYDPPSVLLMRRKPDVPRLFHAACFMGWLASRANVVTGTEMLSDQGLIHELAHYLHIGPDYMKRQAVRDALREIERAIPGYMPEGW